jgi:VanZ family protein
MSSPSGVANPYYGLLAARAAFLVAVGLLASGSVLPAAYLPPYSLQDKLLHFLGYAIVGSLAMLAIRHPRRQLGGLLALTLLGVLLELAQQWVPGRAFELADMAANGCGVFCGFQVMRLLLS